MNTMHGLQMCFTLVFIRLFVKSRTHKAATFPNGRSLPLHWLRFEHLIIHPTKLIVKKQFYELRLIFEAWIYLHLELIQLLLLYKEFDASVNGLRCTSGLFDVL